MPPLKIEKIISFSSEDPVHVCSNILSSDSTKKWKCQTPGEKWAIVVLQLEQPTVITGIDIGNEHSAFVEVLASRSSSSEDYKVLLVSSSFMTPIESRSSQNVNKVRMFTRDQLSKPECDEKWDRIKVVCTQPFNKHVQYGLSFVKFHTQSGKETPNTAGHIGKFTLRPESPESFSAGSLFSKRKELKQEEKLSGAAAIRDAMRESASPVCKPKLFGTTSKRDSLSSSDIPKAKPRNRDEILYSKDEEERHDKIDRLIEKKAEETKEKEKAKETHLTPKPKKIDLVKNATPKNDLGKAGTAMKIDSGTPSRNKKDKENIVNTPSSSKKNNAKKDNESFINTPSSSSKKEKDNKRKHNNSVEQIAKKIKVSNGKPFNRLLEGVTLVISGIQNPDRANLRTKALEMGAKYKPDWESSCTHLICAFVNTPKFNQVKGKGKIVKRSWIDDCHSQRKYLPWRRYALDRNDKGDESEEEICELVEQESPKEVISVNDDDDDYDRDQIEEGSDTEERVARILQQQKRDSVYDADTDDEMLKFHTRNLG